jgi:HAE1 family hydrophobic/amphiphilic exporter-1
VQRLEEIKPTLPPGTKVDLVKDSGKRVTAAVKNVEEALILGALLTVLVVYRVPEFLAIHRHHRNRTADLGLASFIAVWALGFNLETMSLLGLSLAIGILIDDAIVVRENIVRHIEWEKTISRRHTTGPTKSVSPWRPPRSRFSPCSCRSASCRASADNGSSRSR